MNAKDFGELCKGTSEMLNVLGDQALQPSVDGELQFDLSASPATIKPLADIIAAICKATAPVILAVGLLLLIVSPCQAARPSGCPSCVNGVCSVPAAVVAPPAVVQVQAAAVVSTHAERGLKHKPLRNAAHKFKQRRSR